MNSIETGRRYEIGRCRYDVAVYGGLGLCCASIQSEAELFISQCARVPPHRPDVRRCQPLWRCKLGHRFLRCHLRSSILVIRGESVEKGPARLSDECGRRQGAGNE